jgi:hypothetical protein
MAAEDIKKSDGTHAQPTRDQPAEEDIPKKLREMRRSSKTTAGRGHEDW